MAVLFEQRYNDQKEMLRVFMDGRQADIWTALPGIIVSYNAPAQTVVVQPVIQELYTGANLQQTFINLPTLLDVPVIFPRGGTYTLTFPIQPGDECLVIFSSRCIDNWWSQGEIQNQYEKRMHDLSDGFCIVGPWSQKTVPQLVNVSTTTTQLRTNDQTIYLELDEPNEKVSIINNENLSIVMDAKAETTTITNFGLIITLDANNKVLTVFNNELSIVVDAVANVTTVNSPTLNINSTTSTINTDTANIFAATEANVTSPNVLVTATVADVVTTSEVNVTAPTITLNASIECVINSPLTQCNGLLQATGEITAGSPGTGPVGLTTHRHGITGNVASATIAPTSGT